MVTVLLLILASAIGGAAAESSQFTLDLEGPARLELLAFRGEFPSRVDIWVRGPSQYIDKSETVTRLVRNPPLLSLRTQPGISNLVVALAAHDNKERIPNVMRHLGYTYHVLLFYDKTTTVMHFRIFEPTDIETEWCMIDPRSDTGFGYCNNLIRVWLHANIKPETSRKASPSNK